MRIVVNIEISDAMLAGMATGAATMLVPVVVLSAAGAFVESAIAMGGPGGFWRKIAKGASVCGPAGAATGLAVVVAGAPWWAAAPAALGVLGAIHLGHRAVHRRRAY